MPTYSLVEVASREQLFVQNTQMYQRDVTIDVMRNEWLTSFRAYQYDERRPVDLIGIVHDTSVREYFDWDS